MRNSFDCTLVPPQNLENQKGNTIVLTLGMLITIGIVLPLGIGQLTQSNQVLKRIQVVGARDSLVAQVRKYSSLGATFRSSLDPSLSSGVNSDLQNCILGNGSTLCQGKGVEYPVTLYYPVTIDAGASGSGLKILSGFEDLPALYNSKGNPCTTAASTATVDCPFEVYTTFTAKCAGDAPSCATAESLSVHYTVRISPAVATLLTAKSGGTYILASVSEFAPLVTRDEILPGLIGSADGNIMVTILTTDATGNSSTKKVKPAIDPGILAAVKEGGVLDNGVANDIALAFQAARITDASFITAVVAAGNAKQMGSDFTKVVTAIGGAGIVSIDAAALIARAGITDPNWALLVVESGVTNTTFIGALQGTKITTAAQLSAVVNAVSGVPNGAIAVALAKTGITDAVTANAIWSAVSTITDINVAKGIIGGGFTDPSQISAIATAVSVVPNSDVAAALAKKGVTDPAVAKNLWEIVSVISDSGTAAKMAAKGIPDPAVTVSLVSQYLAASTTTTVGTTSPTVTTVPPPSTSTSSSGGTSAPAPLTLLSTCVTSQCTTPAF